MRVRVRVRVRDAVVGVGLVDADQLQVAERLGPLRVVGQQRRVEEVGVGQDHVAPG